MHSMFAPWVTEKVDDTPAKSHFHPNVSQSLSLVSFQQPTYNNTH